MKTSAQDAAETNGSGRRFEGTSVRVPLLTSKLADKIADGIRKSRIPPGAVAEKFGIPAERLRRWLFDGRRFLEAADEGEEMTAQAYLAYVVDMANAERLEKMTAEAWEAGPREFSHSYAQWLMGHAASRHVGTLARRADEREATIEDKRSGVAGGTNGSPAAVASMTIEQLAELASRSR